MWKSGRRNPTKLGTTIVITNGAGALSPCELVAVMVPLYVPAVVGVPANNPVAVLIVLNGAGPENENVEFSVTDFPKAAPSAINWGVVPLIQLSPFPPVNIPIAPSTRKRTLFGRVEAF